MYIYMTTKQNQQSRQISVLTIIGINVGRLHLFPRKFHKSVSISLRLASAFKPSVLNPENGF